MNERQINFPADFCFVPGIRVCISRSCAGLGFEDHEEVKYVFPDIKL